MDAKEKIQKRLEELLPAFMESPRLYVHEILWDHGTTLVIETDRDFFRRAVFLDGRMLRSDMVAAVVDMQTIERATGPLPTRPDPCHFIFHIGHAGSTLISRLLDQVPGVLGLREPMVLRPLALKRTRMDGGEAGVSEAEFATRILLGAVLLARRFAPEETVIIKATSICNNLGSALLGLNDQNRALGLKVGLEVFLANMLFKEEMKDVPSFLAHRLAGLKARVEGFSCQEEGLSAAQMITLSWLAEALEISRLATGPLSDRVLVVDFDEFLKNREQKISIILQHFSLPADEKTIEQLAASEVLSSYGKLPSHPYTTELRDEILNNSRRDNAAGIKEGLGFAENLAARHPELQNLLKGP